MVGKVPVVNAVANRFTVASNQLSHASAKVTGVANAVGNAAESTVSNVADYAMNVPLGEQTAGGYVQAVAAVPVGSLMSSYASTNARKVVNKIDNNLKIMRETPYTLGDYVDGFTDSITKTRPENLSIGNVKYIVTEANRDGMKEAIKGLAERVADEKNS